MSPADNRGQSSPHLVVVAVYLVAAVACRDDRAPRGCPELSTALASAESASASEIAHRVDAAVAEARSRCPSPVNIGERGGIAHQLARARIADERPDVALGELPSLLHPAIAVRRSELLDRLGRTHDAAAALAPALVTDEQARARHALLAVSAAAKNNDPTSVLRALASAPIVDRPRLAHRAVADASEAFLDALAQDDVELATAVADRLEQSKGPAAARAARERAVELEPNVAEHWDAVARSRIAAGAIDEALAAWDRATAIAPAQPSFRIMPVRALVIAGEGARATQRAHELASVARSSSDVELVVTASNAAAAAADRTLGIELARLARSRRPADGRLAFLVAQRLAESSDIGAAADAYAELLVCGAHGRAWHRHEVAARLAALGDPPIVTSAVTAKRSCTAVESADLDTYVSRLKHGVPLPHEP